MKLTIYGLITAGLLILFFILKSLLAKRNQIPVELYKNALRKENRGDMEAAILDYEAALEELNKTKHPAGSLMHKIQDKLAVLRSVVNYGSGFRHTKNTGYGK